MQLPHYEALLIWVEDVVSAAKQKMLKDHEDRRRARIFAVSDPYLEENIKRELEEFDKWYDTVRLANQEYDKVTGRK